MGRPHKAGAQGARHRAQLTRRRKSVRFDLREEVYSKLRTIAETDRDGSLTKTIERLIEAAQPLPRP